METWFSVLALVIGVIKTVVAWLSYAEGKKPKSTDCNE